MSKLVITSPPWSVSLNPLELLHGDSAASIWKDNKFPDGSIGSTLICECSRSAGDKEAQANASAIVLAVNNTYGASINPEAVTDLKNALELIATHFFHEGNNSPRSIELQAIYKAVIEKATL